jgi:hypothetical protein
MIRVLWRQLATLFNKAFDLALPYLRGWKVKILAVATITAIILVILGIFRFQFGFGQGQSDGSKQPQETLLVQPTATVQPAASAQSPETAEVVILTPTPPSTNTLNPTLTPTVPPDQKAAVDAVYQANKELKMAFLDVNKNWIPSQFKYWCSNVVPELNQFRDREKKQFQPKDGIVEASFETIGQVEFGKLDSGRGTITQVEKWTYKWEIDPDVKKPTRPESYIEDAPQRYVYTLQPNGGGVCISGFIASPKSTLTPASLPTTPTASPTQAAVQPTLTPTVNTPRGLNVDKIEAQEPLRFNSPVVFKVTFVNTSATGENINWLVKIFKPRSENGLDKSFGETKPRVAYIQPGLSSPLLSENWSTGKGDCLYSAEAYVIGETNQIERIPGPPATRAIFDFRFCSD